MKKVSKNTKLIEGIMFYTFAQNNSGGCFDVDDKVTHFVIIEADNANLANELAESIGIYFDGVYDAVDCPCCGDRWHTVWGRGTDVPLIYGIEPYEYKERLLAENEVYCRVFYQDGRIAEYKKQDNHHEK